VTNLDDDEDDENEKAFAKRGRTACGELRSQLRIVSLLSDLVSGLEVRKGKEPVDAAHLLTVYEDLQAESVAISSYPLTLIACQLISVHTKDGDFVQAARSVILDDANAGYMQRVLIFNTLEH
jgi:hypothetical protein